MMVKLRNPIGATKKLACRDMRPFECLTLSHMSFNLYTYKVLQPSQDNRCEIFILNLRLFFLNSPIVNQCSVIRNTKTCEIFLKPRYLAWCVSFYYYWRSLLQAWLLPDLNTIPNNCVGDNSL